MRTCRTRAGRVVLAGCFWVVLAGLIAPGRASDAPAPAPTVAPPSVLTPQQLAEERELIRLLADTLEQVRANYVDSQVTERELVEAAIQGMMSKLDPYSDYIAPTELDQFRKGVEREFVGIGIQVAERDGQIQIVSPLFDTPAWRAGLRAGDASSRSLRPAHVAVDR